MNTLFILSAHLDVYGKTHFPAIPNYGKVWLEKNEDIVPYITLAMEQCADSTWRAMVESAEQHSKVVISGSESEVVFDKDAMLSDLDDFLLGKF